MVAELGLVAVLLLRREGDVDLVHVLAGEEAEVVDGVRQGAG